jgi:hypothetical protein
MNSKFNWVKAGQLVEIIDFVRYFCGFSWSYVAHYITTIAPKNTENLRNLRN